MYNKYIRELIQKAPGFLFFIFMEGGAQMEYTDYGVVWADGIERCTDNSDEKEEQEES